MIDSAACEGMIVVEGPDRLRRDAVLVRCGVPLYLLVTAAHVTLTPAQREDIVVEGIAAPWSLLCLCDRQPMYSRFPEVEPSAPTAAGGRGPVRAAHPGGPGVRRRRGGARTGARGGCAADASLEGDDDGGDGSIPAVVMVSAEMSAAMHADDPDAVRKLIETGELVDRTDRDLLRTPLLWAAEGGYTDLGLFV